MIPPPPSSTLFPYTTLFRSTTSPIASRSVVRPAVAKSRSTRSDFAVSSPVGEGTAEISAVKSSRSEEHTSELQSLAYLVCRLLLEKKKNKTQSRDKYNDVND